MLGWLLPNYFMQGFAPADEILLFRQKDPKPFPPVRSPLGPSATVPNQDGSGTRCAQTALAERPIRYGGSAAHEGGEIFKKQIKLANLGKGKARTSKTQNSCLTPFRNPAKSI